MQAVFLRDFLWWTGSHQVKLYCGFPQRRFQSRCGGICLFFIFFLSFGEFLSGYWSLLWLKYFVSFERMIKSWIKFGNYFNTVYEVIVPGSKFNFKFDFNIIFFCHLSYQMTKAHLNIFLLLKGIFVTFFCF